MPVRVSSSVKNACTRIVLSQKCQYPYRPQSKMPVPVLSSVKNACTRIILSQKCLYPYRPQSKMPVPVSSYQYRHWSHGCLSNGILPVWARQNKGQYPYRPQSKRLVPVSSSVKKASTRIVLSRTGLYPYRPQSKRPVPVSSYQYSNTDTGVTDV